MGSPKKTATRRSATSTRKRKAPTSGTRTSSRSAKRRSPKTPPPDASLMEVERLQFLRAMDRYKRKTGKTFPSWTEVLAVLRSIGWVSPVRLDEQTKQPS
jgi:hypothetical protein